MSNFTHNQEPINGGEDRLILEQEVGRRASMVEIAQINANLAIQFSSRAHLLKSTVDLKGHFSRKDFSAQTNQAPINVSENVQTDADRVMQTGDFDDLRTPLKQNEYEKVLTSLNPEVNKTVTPDTDEELARESVNAIFAEIGLDDSIFEELDRAKGKNVSNKDELEHA